MTPRFVSPPDPARYNQQVWELVRRIPRGRVATYGQIAALLPPPAGVDPQTYLAFGARWVGNAMAHCPADIPWHRVINAQGKISFRRSGGHERQRRMLWAEGVVFDEHERIDLERFGWPGPTKE